MTDMQNVNSLARDREIYPPAGCASVKCAADFNIKRDGFRSNGMRLWHQSKAKDQVAYAGPPILGCTRIAVLQPRMFLPDVIRRFWRDDDAILFGHQEVARPSKNAAASTPSPARA